MAKDEDKIRADLLLVKKGMASSRTHAQALIDSDQVFYFEGAHRKSLKKASALLHVETHFDICDGAANRFVSRGGLKLEGALKQSGLELSGLKVLDVGISTGGFSDCVLQGGASKVVGVDVGHGQVHPNLLKNPHLTVYEGINARHLMKDFGDTHPEYRNYFDLIVMDVSFISMTLILPQLEFFLKPQGQFLGLVKPQFEVGVDGLSKGGIVKDASLYEGVREKITVCCQQVGLKVEDYFSSPIAGKDGNLEFFVRCSK